MYNLRKAREAAGLTQEQVALEIGSAQFQIYKYESGKQDITLGKAILLAKLYGCTLDYLAGMEEPEKSPFPENAPESPVDTEV